MEKIDQHSNSLIRAESATQETATDEAEVTHDDLTEKESRMEEGEERGNFLNKLRHRISAEFSSYLSDNCVVSLVGNANDHGVNRSAQINVVEIELYFFEQRYRGEIDSYSARATGWDEDAMQDIRQL